MRYYPATSQSRGLQTLSRLRRRLENPDPVTLAPVLFDLSEWADLAVAPHETVERAATLVRVFAEDFEFFSKNADRILAGEEEENIPCSDAARPLWVAVSEAAGMAEELRELTRNPPPPLNDVPEWLERAMDRALAAVSTKH